MYKPIDADVIIIGSGLAGLTAAFSLHLKEPTLHFNVLEGSADVGGRAFSVPIAINSNGTSLSYFDVGGQWVCQEQNHLLSLLDTLNIPTITDEKLGKIIIEYEDIYTVNSIKSIFNFFRPYDMYQFTKFIDKVEALCKRITLGDEKCIKQLDEITLGSFIETSVNSKAVRAVINYIVCFNCGIRPWQISALFYMFFCISTKGISNQLPTGDIHLHELRIKGGVKNICDKIVDEIGRRHVITDEYVTDIITYPNGHVEVRTMNKSYFCYDVVIAISPKDVLNINFEPPLPTNKINGIRNTSTNIVISFIVTYSTDFWTDMGLSGDVYVFNKSGSQGPIDFCTNITHAGKPALTGRIFDGNAAQDNVPVYKQAVLEQLARYFGEDALNPVDYFEKSYSLGASQMCCWDVGNIDYIRSIVDSCGRLFWAGAETSPEWYGYLAGAVFSGKRAAIEVLYDLRPSLLTSDDMMVLSPTRRSQRSRLKETPKNTVYYCAVHWKYYVSVSLIVLLVLWRCKNKYLKK